MTSPHNLTMDSSEVERWFARYLADFVALGRGDVDDLRQVLTHYGVPLLLSTENVCRVLSDEQAILELAQHQVDDLRAAGYDRSDELLTETTILNSTCATHHGRFSRLRKDGTEIAQIEATYLITDGPAGPRISAIIVHSAS